MTLTDILLMQLADPFRIGLILALVYTAERNRAVTGSWLPLLLGVAFIALMIPMTLQTNSTEPLQRLALVGLISNSLLLAVALAARWVWLRLRR
ncbi:hypothetical protein [Rhodobacter ferrooxidans]|uniref:Uncharacterized protein n=1 Tax=Rhodobacter ferrooxidans TaxID=371731 RepID=C8RYU7_9RHOB|nr:hypothetical protein [Rhodobacter sp. SW2]EEW26285.1 conserved hypothetical protein [Rhodobacter sp. SW2]